MPNAPILAQLVKFDAEWSPRRTRAISMEFRGGGGCGAWNCGTDDGAIYVVKCQNNGQDRGQGPPLKVLVTELVCGRLGQLFHPALCPDVAIVDVPLEIAQNAAVSQGIETPAAGPSFGSRLYDQAVETKAGGVVDSAGPADVARIIVFQTWLRGEDVAALVPADGGRPVSIDHGWYLTGSQWNDTILGAPEDVSLVMIPCDRERLADEGLFRGMLDELAELKEEDIVRAFAGVPIEWGASPEFRARLAEFVLARRELVEAAVSGLWKGGP